MHAHTHTHTRTVIGKVSKVKHLQLLFMGEQSVNEVQKEIPNISWI